MRQKLTIYEEETNLLWGLIVVVASAFATYLLGDAFMDESLFTLGFRQLSALFLFVLSFVGIIKVTEPLYRFDLIVEGEMLTIEVYKGEDPVKEIYYNLNEFEELRFAPGTPSFSNEALFDFSPNYHLVFKSRITGKEQKLIDLGRVSFTLKVPDIAEIIRFLRHHNSSIKIPDEQAAYVS